MFDLKSVFITRFSQKYTLSGTFHINSVLFQPGSSPKKLDFGPELTFEPGHLRLSKFHCPALFMALGPKSTHKLHAGTLKSKEKC